MCTIIVLNRATELAPVVIAANRDEFYARASRPPNALGPDTSVVAGIDEVAGGTWMGSTADGFFVGLTNQRQGRVTGKRPRSRGAIVTAALETKTLDGIEELLTDIEPGTIGEFNLIYGTSKELHCAYVRDGGLEFEPVPTGISVLPNDVLGSPDFPKAARAKALAEAAARDANDWPALATSLQAALASHEFADIGEFSALDAMCIHTPFYGTRSFAIIALGDGELVHYLHGEGPPCLNGAEEYAG